MKQIQFSSITGSVLQNSSIMKNSILFNNRFSVAKFINYEKFNSAQYLFNSVQKHCQFC